MNTIKLYLHSMRMLLKSQLQYPASFIMQTLAQLVMEGGEFMAVILIVAAGAAYDTTGGGGGFLYANF